MVEFLKQLFSTKGRELTLMILDGQDPVSYKFNPQKLLVLYYGSLAAVVVVVLLLVMFTPLGTLVYNQEDEELRAAVIEVHQEVTALRDSLSARDMQLAEIQRVLAFGEDTTFQISDSYRGMVADEADISFMEPESFSRVSTSDMITENEIIFSGLLKNAPEFPTSYPVSGTLTRGYNADTGHFGIDIATKDNIPFRAIAEGAIVSQDWTANFGYVIYIQHSNGLISVYKHASSISKSPGDIVLKGDILGRTGDAGVMSSGPHLHLEIWKNGVPQNPISYLVES